MTSVSDVLWFKPFLLPVIATAYVPALLLLPGLTTSVELAPPAVGTTEGGLKVAVTPKGNTPALRLTGTPELSVAVSVTLELPLAPRATVSEVGLAAMVNSGPGVGVLVGTGVAVLVGPGVPVLVGVGVEAGWVGVAVETRAAVPLIPAL